MIGAMLKKYNDFVIFPEGKMMIQKDWKVNFSS